jgi:hypothetical protein
MTKLEKAALRQVIAAGKRPGIPGARVPNPDQPDHWISSGYSADEVGRMLNSPDFQKGWNLGSNYFADALTRVMAMTPAELRAFTGSNKQIKT